MWLLTQIDERLWEKGEGLEAFEEFDRSRHAERARGITAAERQD